MSSFSLGEIFFVPLPHLQVHLFYNILYSTSVAYIQLLCKQGSALLNYRLWVYNQPVGLNMHREILALKNKGAEYKQH